MPQPSTTHNNLPLDAARAKQLNARRKMQSLPKGQVEKTNRTIETIFENSLPNINWHDHYLQRVAK